MSWSDELMDQARLGESSLGGGDLPIVCLLCLFFPSSSSLPLPSFSSFHSSSSPDRSVLFIFFRFFRFFFLLFRRCLGALPSGCCCLLPHLSPSIQTAQGHGKKEEKKAVFGIRMPRYHSVDDDVHQHTKWWSDYPTQKYTDLARAQTAFNNIIGEVWSKPKRLVRSASYTNLTYYKEAQHDYPIKRSPSVSSLAPSLALPQYYRQAERIVHTERVYKPFIYDWYNKAYSQHRHIDTQREIMRPLKRDPPPLRYKPLKFEETVTRSSWIPYYSNQTRRIYNNERSTPLRSYLHGSQNYLDKYVSSRLKSDDYAQRFAYSAYEWRKPSDHSFNRNFMYGERVYVPHARSNPHSYSSASALRKLYKTTGRFRFA